jgi:hypothetical protein
MDETPAQHGTGEEGYGPESPGSSWSPPAPAEPPPLPPVVVARDVEAQYTRGNPHRIITGAILIFGGMITLLVLALMEQQWRDSLPWAYALAGPVVGKAPDGTIPTVIRPVPIENFPEQAQLAHMLNQLIAMDGGAGGALDVDNTEALLMAEIPEEELSGMLVSGRLPRPGKPEVLAGDLCRVDSFRVDNITFNVVGHLRPGIGGLTFTYYLPKHTAWEPLFRHEETIKAWIAPEGRLDAVDLFIRAGMLPREDSENPAAMMDVQEVLAVYEGSHLHPMVRTLPALAYTTVLVLLSMLAGITLVTTHIFLLLRPHAPHILRALCQEIARNTRSWYAVHAICYGAFGGLLLVGTADPLGNMQVIETVKQAFTEGDLAYIGRAYLSGDIIAAANATWQNNYLLQTVLLGALISIPPLGLGFFKTLLSLGIVGYAMAPVWTDIIPNYVLHSGTMVLELEPYVMVAWVAILWPVWFFRGLREGTFPWRTSRWLTILLQATLLAGVLLYIAALYEGVTLITVAGL